MLVNASGNLIGTDGDGVNDATEGNVIDSASIGIYLLSNADNTVIAGNLIGLNGAGTAAIPSVGTGVYVFDNSVVQYPDRHQR